MPVTDFAQKIRAVAVWLMFTSHAAMRSTLKGKSCCSGVFQCYELFLIFRSAAAGCLTNRCSMKNTFSSNHNFFWAWFRSFAWSNHRKIIETISNDIRKEKENERKTKKRKNSLQVQFYCFAINNFVWHSGVQSAGQGDHLFFVEILSWLIADLILTQNSMFSSHNPRFQPHRKVKVDKPNRTDNTFFIWCGCKLTDDLWLFLCELWWEIMKSLNSISLAAFKLFKLTRFSLTSIPCRLHLTFISFKL